MKRTITVVVLILGLAFAARTYLMMQPPKYLVAKLQSSSLSDWASQYPECRIYRLRKDGTDYYEIGLPQEFVISRFPSGRPAAIFDGRGVFVEWTGDSGDDVAYQEKWQGASLAREDVDRSQIPK